jgi:leader peptidase (prepilin peptidase)/N-methyltransferase
MTVADWVLVVWGVLMLLVIASFTNVIIDRLPLALDEPNEYGELWDTRPWGEVLGGRSRCSDCGAEVRWYDNLPIVSFVVLRGRCRSCGTPYGVFHLVVELLIPLLGVGLTWLVVRDMGWTWLLLPWLFLVPVGVAISAIDLRTLIVPTRIVWPAVGITAVLAVAATLLEGSPQWLLGGLVGVVALAGPLFAIWWVVPAGMGFGDVRLSVLLGMNVGLAASAIGAPLIWCAMFSLMCLFLASVVGIVMALPFLGAGRRKIPFGPALFVAALVCVGLAGPILDPFL